jgi:hypothetical protein
MGKGVSTKEVPQLDHQEIKGFKIWYSDGTYTSKDGPWEKAPVDDVQVVMIYFKKKDALGRHTRLYSAGCDYYGLDTEKGLFTSDFDDISKVNGHVLYGKFTLWDNLEKLSKEAFDDYGDWLDE